MVDQEGITLFDKLTKNHTIEQVVDIFYSKVLADDRVNHFFEKTDMTKQRQM